MLKLDLKEKSDQFLDSSSIRQESNFIQRELSIDMFDDESRISLYLEPDIPLCKADMSPTIRALYYALLEEQGNSSLKERDIPVTSEA